jgi:hypothetical protein
MRKTLTAIVVLLAAGSLAACKMPWDKPEETPPAPVATTAETPVAETTAGPEPTAPVEQTASTDKPTTPEAPKPAPTTK